MIKRTLYFGNPAYLSTRNEQLLIKLPEVEKNSTVPDSFKKESITSIPIEDIGIVILDHQQITVSQAVLNKLLDNNTAVITCDNTHHPTGLMLPLCGHTLQSERFRTQIDASLPLKKQLWQQTVAVKIKNQAQVLKQKNINIENMLYWADSVKSGDTENHEGRAAAYYWKNIFDPTLNFLRDRNGEAPNNILNYGYAILRAIVARSLVGSGLLPTFGIHHRNKYNAYCLADDIMEPYRPYVDVAVLKLMSSSNDVTQLTPAVKMGLLSIATTDVIINGERSPLMVGVQRTTASLARCFAGETRKIAYPEINDKVEL